MLKAVESRRLLFFNRKQHREKLRLVAIFSIYLRVKPLKYIFYAFQNLYQPNFDLKGALKEVANFQIHLISYHIESIIIAVDL